MRHGANVRRDRLALAARQLLLFEPDLILTIERLRGRSRRAERRHEAARIGDKKLSGLHGPKLASGPQAHEQPAERAIAACSRRKHPRANATGLLERAPPDT